MVWCHQARGAWGWRPPPEPQEGAVPCSVPSAALEGAARSSNPPDNSSDSDYDLQSARRL